MRTIVEPKEHIAKLWGQQKTQPDAVYRRMKYVLQVNCEGKTALHNVVTGELIVLDEAEEAILAALPRAWTQEMDELIRAHFLVPEGYDEHKAVYGMRHILRQMENAQKLPGIVKYTILPTTACNARCYYCFEKGTKPVTMTEQTANDTVRFIKEHCNGRKVYIDWFGGEPTVAANRIDQICKGLSENGIEYSSHITTNGYLFDEDMVRTARELWHLESAMITVDGTEVTYNRVKAYPNVEGSPYQRVMRNIGLLLDSGIKVNFRVNLDLHNYEELPDIFDEVKKNFTNRENLQVTIHPVIAQKSFELTEPHASVEWFSKKLLKLHKMAWNSGLLKADDKLLFLQHEECEAASESAITITPVGALAKCPEQFAEKDLVGDLQNGIENTELVGEWHVFADYEKCRQCIFYPYCARVEKCSAGDRCQYCDVLYEESRSAVMKRLVIT